MEPVYNQKLHVNEFVNGVYKKIVGTNADNSHNYNVHEFSGRIRSITPQTRLNCVEYELDDRKSVLRLQIVKTAEDVLHNWFFAGKYSNERSHEISSLKVETTTADPEPDDIIIHVRRADIISQGIDSKALTADLEQRLIEAALEITEGHQFRAARYLGMSPTTFNAKVKKAREFYKRATVEKSENA